MVTGSFVLASIQPRRTRRHGDATLCVPRVSITANSRYRSNGGAVFIGRHSISGRHSKINLVYPNSDLSTGFPWVHLGDTAVHEGESPAPGWRPANPWVTAGPYRTCSSRGGFRILNFTAALSQMVLAGNHCLLDGLEFRELERLRT